MNRLISILLFCIPAIISAQPFGGGILAGFTSAQVDGDKFGGYNKAGLQGGAFTTYQFTTKTSLRFEVKYAGRGAHQKYKEGGQYYKLALHYIDFPLTFRYLFTSKLGVEAGASAGYLFSLMEEGSDEYNMVYEFSDRSYYKSVDIGGIIGLDYKVYGPFTLNFRFYYSVSPIRKDISDNPEFYQGGGGFNNNVLSFGVYYTL